MLTERRILTRIHVPPHPGKTARTAETYPVFINPVSRESFVCIAWGISLRNGTEYYAFEEIGKPPFLFYYGWIMGETSGYGYFPRSQFGDGYEFTDDPIRLGTEVLPPLFRTRNSPTAASWERGYPPFL